MARMHPSLLPWKPADADPFDRVKAAHLLNRAGFGGSDAEIDHIRALGPAAAADSLLDFPDAGADEQSQTDVPNLEEALGKDYPKSFRELRAATQAMGEEQKKKFRQELQQKNREALIVTGAWWLKRMATGPHPLQEKLTLFWHGHFTSSAKDERLAMLMWNQNELLRTHAAGNFRDFVRAISRDPAMLDYLNNQQNRKEHPNENYARELMELFTLGIGNYTETDVKEAARAFTGWSHDGENFLFNQRQHDDGAKTFLGQRGNYNGDDILEIILARPQCAKYIASKIYRFFVADECDDALAESLGDVLRENKYELRPLLRTIFNSKVFYSSDVIGGQIKSPIQLLVGTIRLLDLQMPPVRLVSGALVQMGQVPFAPPNVKGWPGGRMWINTSTLFVRYNTAVFLAGGSMPMASAGWVGRKIGPAKEHQGADFRPKAGDSSEDVADYWVQHLIQRPIADDKKKVLIDALAGHPDREDSVRKMVQLIVSMPEYQLC
ncbi:MAG TPA: DUF1800 domain-containing protein [Tepidisphaeraceae bacterium]|jgi:uncharacterized protein (DUF1800 family)